jgi:predicted RNA-binding protein
MCEFTVVLEGTTVFEDVVYVKAEEGAVYLRDILGRTKTLPRSAVREVDVNSAVLRLRST